MLDDHLSNLLEGCLGVFDGNRNLESVRIESSQQEIDIRNRERSASPIARWAGRGAGAARPHAQPSVLESADRTAACGHGFYGQGRSDKAHAGDAMLELVFVIAVKARDIRARAADVQPDHAIEPALFAGCGRARHAARRTAEQAVLGVIRFGADQTSRTGHHVQPTVGESAPDVRQVVFDDRTKVGIDDRRLRSRQ